MRALAATMIINKPVEAVFAFTINPKNTPKWVDAIVTEETNEWPVKIGTIYRNQRENGEWSEYEMTALDPNKMFVMSQGNDGFQVGYEFKSLNEGAATELKYRIWKDTGELPATLTMDVVEPIANPTPS